jgi:hypothetical protein
MSLKKHHGTQQPKADSKSKTKKRIKATVHVKKGEYKMQRTSGRCSIKFSLISDIIAVLSLCLSEEHETNK